MNGFWLRPARQAGRTGLIGSHVLLLFAEALDAEADGLAGAEEGGGLHAEADAGGGAGGDDVARVKGEELAQVADELADAKDHFAGVAVLATLAIDLEPDGQVLRVGDFVFGDEPGSDWAERVAAFSFGPLAAAVFLERAFGNIVGDAVAGDVVEGIGLGNVLGRLADDDAEFGLPIGLFRTAREADVVVGADDGAGSFHEQDGLFGQSGPGFRGMVGIVEADAHHFADFAHARP